jgi:hypothetical protein
MRRSCQRSAYLMAAANYLCARCYAHSPFDGFSGISLVAAIIVLCVHDLEWKYRGFFFIHWISTSVCRGQRSIFSYLFIAPCKVFALDVCLNVR